MKQYIDVLKDIRDNGFDHPDRTGTGRRSLFGVTMRFNMNDGFPLVTTKHLFYKGAFRELFWFISGSSNIMDLLRNDVHIWDKWAVNSETIENVLSEVEEKDKPDIVKKQIEEALNTFYIHSIGPMYGYVWRHAPNDTTVKKIYESPVPFEDIASDKVTLFKKLYDEQKPVGEDKLPIPFEDMAVLMNSQKVDQLQQLILGLRRDPYSARHCMSAWVPAYLPIPGVPPRENVLHGRGALAPCHVFIQCFVSPPSAQGQKNRLSLMLYQRSNDAALGGPFNIAQYSLLLHLLSHVTDMEPHEFIYNNGDTHLYQDQLPFVDEQIARAPYPLPQLKINTTEKDIFKIRFEDIEIINYQHHKKISYPVSV